MWWGARFSIIGMIQKCMRCASEDPLVQRFDPSRNIVEHYVDGDLVNGETPINRTKAADSLHVWGTSQSPSNIWWL
jgi:hypothetical protein